MPVPVAVLMAMQAGGMITDYLGRRSAIDAAREGADLEQNAIRQSIMQLRIQTADESTRALVDLRKNLGTQMALFAARGIRQGSPITGMVANESYGNFAADERMRKINQLVSESKLKAGIQLSKMHQQSFETQQWMEFGKDIMKSIPTSPGAYSELGKNFGMTSVGS